MFAPGRAALTWFGRLCLLAIPYVLVCNLLYPAGLVPASPVMCPSGLEVETGSATIDATRELTTPWALVCTSEKRLIIATNRWLGMIAVLFLLAVTSYWLRNRITPRELSAPVVPSHV